MKKIVSVILVLVLALALGATAFADSGVPITKNHTDEARSAGGTAWFVSGAANYNSLEWKFMDPAGTFYTVQEFRNRFPYASVDGEHTTNLTIRNLSTDMNGFGVICTFYNNNGPTDTKMAFLYVSAYAAPTYSAPTYTAPTYTAPRTTTTTTTYYIPYGATDGGYTYDANGNLEYDVYYPDGSYSTFYSDGSTFTDNLDGTYMYVSNDGSIDIFADDGYYLQTRPDGSYTEYHGDGFWEAYDALTDSYSGGIDY